MKRTILTVGQLLLTLLTASAQTPAHGYDLDVVTVSGRKLSEMGTTRTQLDSSALRENVIHSMADVLAQNTSIFIKSYGRGTLATASFRGTAPSHTQVQWNGMAVNSPMLGMVDFSLIPSYFIDNATVYHGAGSVGVTGGGLGGAITLETKAPKQRGFNLNFIQGISSFDTYDEFLHLTYGTDRFQTSTRFCFVTSDNDFKYRNFDKIGENNELYPIERNKNCEFQDWHLMQEFFYKKDDRNRFGLSAWFMNSQRGIPMLSVDYRDENRSKDLQGEKTLRVVGNWKHTTDRILMETRVGYTYSDMLYRLWNDLGTEELSESLHAASKIHTGYGSFEIQYTPSEKWYITGSASAYLHAVKSSNKTANDTIKEGYYHTRVETSLYASVRYRPHPRIGLGVDLREESYGDKITPPIPAAFVDFTLWPKYDVVLKGSFTRNYRYPSMNDLYFQPGGNDSLQTEKGYTYEGGVTFGIHRKKFAFTGEGTAYNSVFRDWILWMPKGENKGYWTPCNVKKVHSYGVELQGKLAIQLAPNWNLFMDAHWAWTRSLNMDNPKGWTDGSIGKQLVYIPEFSSSITGRLSWKSWSFSYKYHHYSERYTTSSNEKAYRLYYIGPYYMSDIYLEKSLSLRFADLSLKVCVYNLFNEDYVSVLSRPMAKRNYSLFIGITPKWGHKK